MSLASTDPTGRTLPAVRELVPARGKSPTDALSRALLTRLHEHVSPEETAEYATLSPVQALSRVWSGWQVVGTCTYRNDPNSPETLLAVVLHHPDGAWAHTVIATAYLLPGMGCGQHVKPWDEWEASRRVGWAEETLMHAHITSPGTLEDLFVRLSNRLDDDTPGRYVTEWATVQAILNADPDLHEQIGAVQVMAGFGGYPIDMVALLARFRATRPNLLPDPTVRAATGA